MDRLPELRSSRFTTLWCGPAAVALASDGRYDVAVERMLENRQRDEALARRIRRSRRGEWARGNSPMQRITWSFAKEVRTALELYWGARGGRVEKQAYGTPSTLRMCLAKPGDPIARVINVGDHFVVARGFLLADNNHPRWAWWADHPWGLTRKRPAIVYDVLAGSA